MFISFRNKSKGHWFLKVVIRWLHTILSRTDFISVFYLAIFLEFEMLVLFFVEIVRLKIMWKRIELILLKIPKAYFLFVMKF